VNPYFSYVDTALRTVYFNLNSAFNDKAVQEIRDFHDKYKDSPNLRKELIDVVFKANMTSNVDLQQIYCHEWHHYLQSLFYPYLYYLAIIEYKTIFNLRVSLEEYSGELDLSGNKYITVADRRVYNNLSYQTYTFRYYWGNNGILTIDRDKSGNSSNDENDFSITDLVENSTSFFDYKIRFQEDANPEDFWVWLKNPRNKSYKNLIFFLSETLDKETIYFLLPICTQLAFYTTEPSGAFCTLINTRDLWFDKGDIQFSFQAGKSVLRTIFESREFTLTDYTFIQETPVFFIEDDQYKKIVEESHYYPLSIPARHYFKLLEKSLIDETLLLSIEKKENVKKLQDYNLEPYAIYFNFLDFNTRDNFILYNIEADEILGQDAGLFMSEMAKIKDTTVSLFSGYNKQLPRTCHHSGCPYYEFDLCRRWNAIPANFENCAFPSWFALEYKKIIEPESQKLRPIKNQQELDDLISKKTINDERAIERQKYDVINHGDGKTTLIVRKPTIESGNVEYAISYIEKIKKDQGISKCLGSLILQFDGYHDNESLFQKKEVMEWLQKLKRQFPEALMYLDFDLSKGQQFYILPAFVIYKCNKLKGTKFELHLDTDDLERFLKSEFLIMRDFCKKYNMDSVKTFKSIYKYILF
jgi:hypothetical protein